MSKHRQYVWIKVGKKQKLLVELTYKKSTYKGKKYWTISTSVQNARDSADE